MINIDCLPHTRTDVSGMSPIDGALQKLQHSTDLLPKIMFRMTLSSRVSVIWSGGGGGELPPKQCEAQLEDNGPQSARPETTMCVAHPGLSQPSALPQEQQEIQESFD